MSIVSSPGERQDLLTMCDQEPIHKIGFIQPHGYLLGVSKTNYTLQYVSANCRALFGDIAQPGQPLQALDEKISSPIGGSTLTELLNVKIRGNDFVSYRPYKLKIGNDTYAIITHETQDLIVIEFEPAVSEQVSLETQELLGEIMLTLNVSSNHLNPLLQVVADQMRKLLGYDRIMIYKFWEDWHGEVVAESKTDGLDPFLGLHYPASDIPRQARALYTKNLVRLIADVHAEPVPILSKTEDPLDLSYAQLRAVSPIHIAYLKNMQVGASYSLSLLHKGRLWGLIACHHGTARFLDYDKRKSSEIISQYLANLIDLKTREHTETTKAHYISAVDTLDQQMREAWHTLKGISAHPEVFLSVTNSPGGAVLLDGQLTLFGLTPTEEQVQSILQWLRLTAKREKTFYTTNLSQFIPEARPFSDCASGVLILTISEEMDEYVLWFRPEHLTTVTWAGKNDKNIAQDADGTIRLSPRKSFEKWRQEIRNTAIAWQEPEIRAAEFLREKILSLAQLKSNEIRRLNEKLSQAYDELDSFSYTLSHDLKTPLNTIRGYLELYMMEEDITTHPVLDKVMRNTDLMLEMIANILRYSKLSMEEFSIEDVSMLPILQEITSQTATGKKFERIQLNIPETATVKGNKTMLYQVFLNLIENAVKYADPQKEAYVKVSVVEDDMTLVFAVEDNGLGIDYRHINKIFGLFKRIPTKADIEGSGVGLAIVKKIVEKHEGRIWVDSTLGEGSVFYVALKK